MAKQNSGSPYTTLSIHPVTGMLDTRSRPADLPPGAFRWKQNWMVTVDGKMCRRDGWGRTFPGNLYDSTGTPLTVPNHPGTGVFYHNHDHHHQGATREPITMLFESTDSSGVRRLFDGTQSRISLLNANTGYWTDLTTGKGAQDSRWKAAELQNVVIFANNVDDIYAYNIGTQAFTTVPDLLNILKVRRAKVVIQFSGFIFLMNLYQDDLSPGAPYRKTRVRWSDLNLPMDYDPGKPNSLAGFQDLDYGDEILAAGVLLGSLYIFTRRAIWRCLPAASQTQTFSFIKVYSEPENQTGCLTFPNTLISDGQNFYYASKDAIYRYNPYITAPERPDWLYKAAGVIYRKADTALSGLVCEAPVGIYHPSTKEYWVSWPSGNNFNNNWTLVSQLEQQTADVVDAGFAVFKNFRVTPDGRFCNENQSFLGVSTRDYAIKDIGGIFIREYLTLASNDPTVDLPLNAPDATYVSEGYYSILRGLVPTGYNDRSKRLGDGETGALVDVDVAEQDKPVVMRCKIGNTRNLSDPNDMDDHCAVNWRDLGTIPMTCPDKIKISELQALNQRADLPFIFPCFEQGYFLYFWFQIENDDAAGSPAIGGDLCIQRLDFDVMALSKP